MKDLIRFVRPQDAARILEIYAPYITDTVISFEYEVPTPKDFSARVETISSRYPYLVYEREGKVLGYAYASAYNERVAYDYTVDLSVYVDAAFCGQNIGECLYAALLDILEMLGYYNAYACITAINQNSLNFHKRMGFEDAGTHKLAGFKHGHWLDVCWYSKRLKTHTEAPQPLKPVSAFSDNYLLQPHETYKK